MPINDVYPNLPGFVAQINDFGLVVPTPPQTLSQSVLLLGLATDGPVNTPVRITSLQDAETIFGVTTAATAASGQNFVNRSLTKGLYEAFQSGCTDVRLCRVGGISASLALTDSGNAANQVTVSAVYPGKKYNTITVSYSVPGSGANATGTLTIVTADGVSHPLSIPNPATYSDILNIVNNSGLNIQATQGPQGNPTATANLTAMTATPLAGGISGHTYTDNDYSNALVAAYRQLEDYGVDIIVPIGAYLQPGFSADVSGNPTVANTNGGDTAYYGQNLAQLLARMSQRNNSAFGIISVAPLLAPTFTQVNQRAAALALTVYNFVYAADYATAGSGPAATVNGTDGNPVNLGRFLNICVGPDFIVNNINLGNYVTDACASYAGRVCSLPAQSSTTNKVMNNVLGLSYNFGLSTKNILAGQGFTVFGNVNGTVRTIADNTYAPNGTTNPPGAKASDFRKLSTVRITYAAVEAVRRVTAPYVGEANTPAIVNHMATDVDGALRALKNIGALIDYSYTLIASPTDQIQGNMIIRLVLVPALEIRKIILDVRLSPPGAITVSGGATG